MPSIGDYCRGFYLYMARCINIFAIPHHHVFVYRNGNVNDITYKIVKLCKTPKSLRYSSFLKINYIYQIYYKLTNKYYIVNTTMNDIIDNTLVIPHDQHTAPRSLFAPKTDVYVNGIKLSITDCLYYKNHHCDNILFYVFKFNGIDITNIIIKNKDEIVRVIDKDFNMLTMKAISSYL